MTHRANWTEVDAFEGAGATRGGNSQYRDDAFETTASATWTTSDDWGGLAAELKATVAGGDAMPMAMRHYRNMRDT